MLLDILFQVLFLVELFYPQIFWYVRELKTYFKIKYLSKSKKEEDTG